MVAQPGGSGEEPTPLPCLALPFWLLEAVPSPGLVVPSQGYISLPCSEFDSPALS